MFKRNKINGVLIDANNWMNLDGKGENYSKKNYDKKL